MKKQLLAIAAAAGIFGAGCTSVETTQRFNGVACGTPTEKAQCHVLVEIPAYTIFGLPIVSGGLGDGKLLFFSFSQTTDNAINLLTKEMKKHGVTRVINLNLNRCGQTMVFPFIFRDALQASGTGVCNMSQAVKQAQRNYTEQP